MAKTLVDQVLTGDRGKEGTWKVYVWAERPDAKDYVEAEKMHWKYDSEHPTKAAAEARAKQLK